MTAKLLEQLKIVAGFLPVDMQTAANQGDYVSMAHYRRLLVVLFKAVGTAGDDPIIALEQAQNVAGLNAKALTFTKIYKNQAPAGAPTVLTASDALVEVTQAAAASYTDAIAAEAAAIWAIEVRDTDLDIDGGFDCVAANVADVGGNAQLGCLFYILGEPRYPQSPTGMASAIV
jgi:hypothetical protein